MSWTVYMLKCGDGSLYTGITTDMARRLAEHQSGNGAKYTRARLPVELVYTEPQETQGTATKREMEIKTWSRAEKRALVRKFTISDPDGNELGFVKG